MRYSLFSFLFVLHFFVKNALNLANINIVKLWFVLQLVKLSLNSCSVHIYSMLLYALPNQRVCSGDEYHWCRCSANTLITSKLISLKVILYILFIDVIVVRSCILVEKS